MSNAPQVSAVIHTLSSSRFFDDCLKSVKCQTLHAAHIIVVCDTVPLPKAQQQGLEQVTTPFFVAVDDDMILYQDCFEKLLASISQNEQCADMAYRLRDPILGNVVGIHIYRTEPVKRIGFWHPEAKDPKRLMRTKLIENYFLCKYSPEIVGQHHPSYTPEEIFAKFRYHGEKLVYYQKDKTRLNYFIDKLASFWQRHQSWLIVYAWAGLFAGITGETTAAPLDADRLRKHNLLALLQKRLPIIEASERPTSKASTSCRKH